MAMRNAELIIDIDDQVEQLLLQINSAPNAGKQQNFITDLQNMLVDQVLGPFGLSRSVFEDRDGGAITSLHNFEKGVVANDADQERHNNLVNARKNTFQRADYDKRLNERFADMKSADGKYYDGYKSPGTELPEGPRTAARDHVIAASEIERSARGHLAQSREERIQSATLDENVVLTGYNMNSSKKEEDLLVWAAKPNSQEPDRSNADYYDLDEDVLREKHSNASAAIEKAQKEALLLKQGSELVLEGGKAAGFLAMRQVLGLILKDLIKGLVDDIRYLVREGFDGARSLMTLIKERIQNTFKSIQENWAEYLKESTSAGLSGFLSTLLTLIINSFVTTAKNIVTLIREGVLALFRSIKIILFPPENMSGSDIVFEVVRLLSAAIATCIGLALEEVIKKALESIPLLAPMATDLARVIAGIITGGLTLLTLLAFDRIKEAIAFRNKRLADIHRGQAIGLLQIKQTVLLLDAAHDHIRVTAQTLRLQLEDGKDEIKTHRDKTDTRIASYETSVQALDDLLEQF